MKILDYFIGVNQSKYASIAIFLAIITICIAILVTYTDVSIGNRLGVVFCVILLSIVPVGLSLFELTCIVTGSNKDKYNLCNIFAWIVAIMVIIYCFILIILTIISIFTYKKAVQKINISENNNNVSKKDADMIAKNMMESNINTNPIKVEELVDSEYDTKNNDNYVHSEENKELHQEVQGNEVEHIHDTSIKSSEFIGYDNKDSYMSVKDNFLQTKIETFNNKNLQEEKESEKESEQESEQEPEPYSTSDDVYAPL